MGRVFFTCALLLLVLAGCEKGEVETAIRVIVDTDLKVGSELTRFEVRIFDADGKNQQRLQVFSVSETKAAARYVLPMSFKLVPESQNSTYDFRIVVTGIGPQGAGGSDIEVVEQQAIASFKRGETLRLDMFLGRSCLLKLCRDDGERGDLSCDATSSTCAAVPVRDGLPVAKGDEIAEYEEDRSRLHMDGAIDEADAGSGPSAALDAAAASPFGIALLNSPCSLEGARACASGNSTEAMICAGEKWLLRTVCEENARCDTGEGPQRGTCQPVAGICSGKVPGQPFCQAGVQVTCSSDLLTYASRSCPANQHCLEGTPSGCACDDGFAIDAAGACVSVNECLASPCANDGKCNDTLASYSCDCTATGYEGPNCTHLVGACADKSACADEYPCITGNGENYCLGQFARWLMPDSRGGKVAAVYGASTNLVYDNATGLIWQRTPPEQYADCDASGNAGAHCLLSKAQSYCSHLTLDGFSDWRVPSYIELISILDYTKTAAPYLDDAFGKSPADANVFWSSSTDRSENSGYILAVNFAKGWSALGDPAVTKARTRCVRGRSNSALGPHTTESAGRVTDNWTKLIWTKPSATEQTIATAVAQCAAYGDGSRLPTVKELATLLDPSRPDRSPVLGDITAYSWFWSATVNDANERFVMGVFAGVFVAYPPEALQTEVFRTICVR